MNNKTGEYKDTQAMKRRGIWTIIAVSAASFLCAHSPALAIDDLSLNVAAGSTMVPPGGSVTVTLDVANLSGAINGVQVFLAYDTSLLTLVDIVPNATIGGVGWTEGVEIDNAGSVDYVASMNGGSTAADHTIATLTFTAIGVGTASISFRPDVPPVFTKLMLVDNTELLPTVSGSGSIVITSATTRITAVEHFYAGRFSDAQDTSLVSFGAGSTATIGNISNYTNGITGIRITFDAIVDFTTLDPTDAVSLEWTTGNGTTFTPVTDVFTNVAVVTATVSGVTEMTIVVADGHIRRRWLKVTLDATQITTGGVSIDGELSGNPIVLPSGDGSAGGNAVLFIGNMAGDSDGDRLTSLDDVISIRSQVNLFLSVPIDNAFDVDKDSVVTLDDVIESRTDVNLFVAIPIITPVP